MSRRDSRSPRHRERDLDRYYKSAKTYHPYNNHQRNRHYKDEHTRYRRDYSPSPQSNHRDYYRKDDYQSRRSHRDRNARRSYECTKTSSRQEQERYKKYDDKEGHYEFKINETILDRCMFLFNLVDVINSFMGEGTFARVVRCLDLKYNKHVAIKIVRSVPKYTESAKIEVDILKDVAEHDQKDKYHCIRLISHFTYRNHMCLVFPLYGPSLYDRIKSTGYTGFSIHQVRIMTYELVRAVHYMHSRLNLVHTDLKPENILTNNEHDHSIKVIDFGSATYNNQRHASIISTRHYRAPEVILDEGWSYPADMWSVGCIMIELFTGDAVFQTHENREHLALMEAVLGPIPKSCVPKANMEQSKYFLNDRLDWPHIASSRDSIEFVQQTHTLQMLCENHQDMYDLARRLLSYRPEERMTAKQALQHHFFSSLHKMD
ncbi:serine/threonine-protein kinase AFC2 [Acrasis kona]|uniref:Serine/threonine-protein kinase AFC2 n=1 Tax=Acrasis kona TaxID=1008807 RepID=A0AAW2ZI47_9EUKA